MRERKPIGGTHERSSHPRHILARTFQRREEIDFDWYLGKADAAIYNLNEAGWRIVRTGDDGLRHGSKPHVAIFEEWTLDPKGRTR